MSLSISPTSVVVPTPLEVDAALERAGGLGSFQKVVVIVLAWPFVVLGPLALLWVFVGMEPHGLRTNDCQQTLHDPSLSSMKTRSAALEWDIACKHEEEVTLISSIFFFGFMLGATGLGWASDRFGRRLGFLVAASLVQISLAVCAVAPGVAWFAVGRAIGGVGAGGLGLCSAVWSAELLGKHRSILLLSTNTAFALGMCLLSGLAWKLPSWREQCWAVFVLGLPNFCIYKLLPDSPKWLHSTGNIAEAERVLAHISKVNRAPQLQPWSLVAQDRVGSAVQVSELWGPVLRYRSVAMMSAWGVASLCYYCLALNANKFGSNIYIVNAVGALIEVPAYVFVYALVDKLGRRSLVVYPMMFAAFTCVMADHASSQDMESVVICLVMMARFAVATAFAVLHLWGAELFPTPIRAAALGAQSTLARVAGMIAPVVLTYSHRPLLAFSLPLLLGAALCARVAETTGRKLPDTIEDSAQQECTSSEVLPFALQHEQKSARTALMYM